MKVSKLGFAELVLPTPRKLGCGKCEVVLPMTLEIVVELSAIEYAFIDDPDRLARRIVKALDSVKLKRGSGGMFRPPKEVT